MKMNEYQMFADVDKLVRTYTLVGDPILIEDGLKRSNYHPKVIDEVLKRIKQSTHYQKVSMKYEDIDR